MNSFIDQIKSFTKHLTEDVAALFTEHSKGVQINELIPLIIQHQYVSHTQRELLGLTFNTYKIDFSPFLITLETKGKQNQQILEFTVQSEGMKIYSYKSYDASLSLHDRIALPKNILNYLS
ncbi:hypothetical protein [Halalkalibacter urbisdiaboli]|uniref:hypothetical protein n=1 Tax=Halalkalibacter urbisdiaboli TaxID=1960589 RepID=UPI000B44A68F|nr:hypothetical protein [Halalkalibacter urbisdiaboli]